MPTSAEPLPFHIRVDDLRGKDVQALLREHLAGMASHSPPESMHALDLDGLRHPDITFWTAWDGAELLGCGALREAGPDRGEIKSMRTSASHLRRGAARAMLGHIVDEARRRRYRHLFLETGSMGAFEPAHRLYRTSGFVDCEPFGDYVADRHSVFMTLAL